ncbi:hypothetical protein [Bradyrhizobium sp.]|jgi:hypothetical protein|uniref:hypothetical protein n=1 Tax=Bradyrhizobium sp. TaxID=376 RepID=UPI003C574865
MRLTAYQNVKSGRRRDAWRLRASMLFPEIPDAPREALLPRWKRPPTEIKMQKAAFGILGALLIAGSMVQVAAASEHHMRTGRGHHRWDRAYDQLSEPGFSTPQMSYGKPVAHETRSCDKFWCYPD